MALVPTNDRPVMMTDTTTGRARFYNQSGQQAIKGGQTVDASLFDAIKGAYSNLIYHPGALVLLVFGIFIFVAEFHNTHGPLELIADKVASLLSSPDVPGFVRGALRIVFVFFTYLIRYKVLVGKLALVWFTWVCKPSTRHMIIALFLSTLVLIRLNTYLELFVLSQLFYLYAMLRSPLYKLACVVIFVAVFVAEIIDMSAATKSLHTLIANATVINASKPLPPNFSVPTARRP